MAQFLKKITLVIVTKYKLNICTKKRKCLTRPDPDEWGTPTPRFFSWYPHDPVEGPVNPFG